MHFEVDISDNKLDNLKNCFLQHFALMEFLQFARLLSICLSLYPCLSVRLRRVGGSV